MHGDKYNYSKVKYVNNYTKVCIICPKHSEFEQSPYQHLQGQGCPICSNEATCERCRPPKKNLLKRLVKLMVTSMIIQKVNYVNNKTKVCIVCPEHGGILANTKRPFKWSRLSKCRNEANGERCRSSKEEFITMAREVHGDKYDYSKVKYIGAHTKVLYHL